MSVRKRTTGAGSAWILGFCENTAEDLKSPILTGVRVRVPPPEPVFMRVYGEWALFNKRPHLLFGGKSPAVAV